MDDLEFVQRCVNGDKQSWDKFVDKYSRLIYNYIYSVLKIKGLVVSAEEVGDLFQGIFLSLVKDNFKKLRSFSAKNGCSLASWLRQVAVNYTIDYSRKFRPLVSLDAEDDEGFSLKEILADESTPVSEKIVQEERFKHLKECIAALEREDKYFLELHINQGLTLEEIKGHLRVSRGAVDMRKSGIIEKLKKCFKSKGFLLD